MIDPAAPRLLGLATYKGKRYYILERRPGMILLYAPDGLSSLWVGIVGVEVKLWSRAYCLRELQEIQTKRKG